MRTREAPLPAGKHDYGLRACLEKLNGRQNVLRLQFGEPSPGEPGTRGWQRCTTLLSDPAGFTRWHARVREWLLAEYGEAPDRTAAGYIKSWYLHVPAFLGALLFHHERRVPSLHPRDISFRIAPDGRPHADAIALASSDFACLPNDPAAGTAEASVVASEHELANLFRVRFAAHAAQFIPAYHPPVHFGKHTLWAAATDAIDSGLWKAGKFGGDEGAGVADAALVLPDRIDPFTSASTLHVAHDPGDADKAAGTWTRRKESCCFNYLLETGTGACKTCPRRSPPLAGSRERPRHEG